MLKSHWAHTKFCITPMINYLKTGVNLMKTDTNYQKLFDSELMMAIMQANYCKVKYDLMKDHTPISNLL
jgi:hypothetical protein